MKSAASLLSFAVIVAVCLALTESFAQRGGRGGGGGGGFRGGGGGGGISGGALLRRWILGGREALRGVCGRWAACWRRAILGGVGYQPVDRHSVLPAAVLLRVGRRLGQWRETGHRSN